MSYYVKRTNLEKEYNPVVRAPIRDVDLSADFEIMARAPITNTENPYKTNTVLAHLDKAKSRLSDISGMNLTMICRINDNVTYDNVTVIGERGNYYIVTVTENNETISIAKSCVIFTKRV